MRPRTLLFIILLLVLTVLGIYLLILLNRGYNWRDDESGRAYHEEWDQPYGSMIFYRLLQDYFPDHDFIKIDKDLNKVLPDSVDGLASYVFIGQYIYYDSLDIERLANFVGAGNTALLISKSPNTQLAWRLDQPNCPGEYWGRFATFYDTLTQLSLSNMAEPFDLQYINKNEPAEYDWKHIIAYEDCIGKGADTLGMIDDKANFVSFPLGKGRVLMHSTPLAFSNYQLLRPEMRPYIEEVLNELPNGDIYWDSNSRIPYTRSSGSTRRRRLGQEHPLTYILQQPALAWAWYLLIALAVLYLFFQAKRRQQVVPVLPKNENSSYEFISTIANLHFRERNYKQICIQMMRLFLSQVRERYGIAIPFEQQNGTVHVDDQLLSKLLLRSEYPETNLRDLFRQYAAILQFQPDENMMVDFNQSIETFWKHAK